MYTGVKRRIKLITKSKRQPANIEITTVVSVLNGAQTRNRTKDTGIFSPLLYLLSYLGKSSDY